jgi:MFS family permease
MVGRGLGDTYAVFLLPLEREFGWTRSQVTGVFSIYLLVNGFTAPLVGYVFDRLGPRWVYGAGTACLGAAFFFAAGVTTLWQFYLLVGALIGLGVSLNGMVPASALLSRWHRARLSVALGIAYSAVGAGTLVFVPVAQYLVTQFDWRVAYRVFGLGLLALTPLVLFALPWGRFAAGHPDLQGARARGEGGWTLRSAMGTRIYWALAQVFLCTATAMFSVIVQLVAFFIEAGFSPITAATAFGIIGLLSAASIMGSGFLAERFGIRQTVTLSFCGTASGVVLLLAMASWPAALLLALFVPVFGLCMGVRGPIVSSICARHFAGANVATIYGTIYACNALGAAFGAWAGGVLHDVTGGYEAGFVMALIVIGFAVAPFWTVKELRDFR